MNSTPPTDHDPTMARRDRWTALCHRQASAPDPTPNHTTTALFDIIVALHQHPTRAYHSLEHVDDCLTQLDRWSTLAVHADLIELALWFHDAIYDPTQHDNEARSAACADVITHALRLAEHDRTTVHELIVATAHSNPPNNSDEALIIDIDLSILGSPPDAYDQYARSIRTEYNFVDESTYRTERAKILRRFLERTTIFHHDDIRAQYEQRARENLERECAYLLK